MIPAGYHRKKKKRWTQILTLAKSPRLRAFLESAPCEAEASAGPYSGKASGGGLYTTLHETEKGTSGREEDLEATGLIDLLPIAHVSNCPLSVLLSR